MFQVILKLEEMNYQLKNVNSTSERLIIMDMTEEITKDILKEGYFILEHAPGANVRSLIGIKVMRWGVQNLSRKNLVQLYPYFIFYEGVTFVRSSQ